MRLRDGRIAYLIWGWRTRGNWESVSSLSEVIDNASDQLQKR